MRTFSEFIYEDSLKNGIENEKLQLYKKIQNSDSSFNIQPFKCEKKLEPVFFINTKNMNIGEDINFSNKSKSNTGEANLVVYMTN